MGTKVRTIRHLLHWFLLGATVLAAVSGCGAAGGEAESPAPESPPLMPYGVIVADNVPARTGPGEDYGAVGTFSRGDGLEIISGQGSWYQVRSDRFSGEVWIYAGFVQLTDSLPGIAAPTQPIGDPIQVPAATAALTSGPTVTLAPIPTSTPSRRPTLTLPLPTGRPTGTRTPPTQPGSKPTGGPPQPPTATLPPVPPADPTATGTPELPPIPTATITPTRTPTLPITPTPTWTPGPPPDLDE